jgi:tRNA(fMet)-specific endonuclease VapC
MGERYSGGQAPSSPVKVAMGLMLDSSVLIAAERRRLKFDELVAAHGGNSTILYVSAVTISELLHGAHRADTEARKISRLQHAETVKATCRVLAFGLTEAEEHARIWSKLASQGRGVGTHDLLNAATALAHHHDVVTLNLSEFQRVPGLKVVDASTWLVN